MAAPQPYFGVRTHGRNAVRARRTSFTTSISKTRSRSPSPSSIGRPGKSASTASSSRRAHSSTIVSSRSPRRVLTTASRFPPTSTSKCAESCGVGRERRRGGKPFIHRPSFSRAHIRRTKVPKVGTCENTRNTRSAKTVQLTYAGTPESTASDSNTNGNPSDIRDRQHTSQHEGEMSQLSDDEWSRQPAGPRIVCWTVLVSGIAN